MLVTGEWLWVTLDVPAAQGGHAASKVPKPQPRRNSFEMTVVSLNLIHPTMFF